MYTSYKLSIIDVVVIYNIACNKPPIAKRKKDRLAGKKKRYFTDTHIVLLYHVYHRPKL